MKLDEERGNFDVRFKKPVTDLCNQPHTGFALMMITLPLLERLLRARSHNVQEPLQPAFFEQLGKVFPSLSNEEDGRAFWQAFRNGLLHHATFSLQTRRALRGKQAFSGVVGLQQLDVAIVMVRRTGNPEHLSCMADPIAFARTVVDEVEKDFERFCTWDSDGHPTALVFDAENAASILIDISGNRN